MSNNYRSRSSSGNVWPRRNSKKFSKLDEQSAARLLNLATFGATLESIRDSVGKGVDQWFEEQRTMPHTSAMELIFSKTLIKNYTDVGGIKNDPDNPGGTLEFYSNPGRDVGYADGDPSQTNRWRRYTMDYWTYTAVKGRDQLRQRMAFALSQIFVVSQQADSLSVHNHAMAYFYDILIDYGLGNFRDLLEAVTLSPAMGAYLNMLGSNRPNPATGVHADENYAREVKQLFTIGLDMLDEAGDPILDTNGERIPTYYQIHVEELAKKLTGWSCAPGRTLRDLDTGLLKTPEVRNIDISSDMEAGWWYDKSLTRQMTPYPTHHDPNCVRILGVNGYPTTATRIPNSLSYVGDTVIPGMFTPLVGTNFPNSGLMNQDLYLRISGDGALYQYQSGVYNLLTPSDGDRYVDNTTGTIFERQGSSWNSVGNVYEPLEITQTVFNSYSPMRKKMTYQRYTLKLILDTLFYHQNTPPFICKQLIQRFTSSNPSGAYVKRVVNVFKDNGSGVRGDLFAVLKAILLDSEVALGSPSNYGKVKDPIIKFTHFWREFKASDAYYGKWDFSQIVRTQFVNTSTNTITFTSNHGLADHQAVTYTTAGGNAISGLTDGGKYFVVFVSSTAIQLSKYPGASSTIDLTTTGNDLQRLTPTYYPKSGFSDLSLWGGNVHAQIGQQPLYAPTVFNFFRPDYTNPLLIQNSGNQNFVAPEFEIITENLMIAGRNFHSQFNYQYADANLVYPQHPDGKHIGIDKTNKAVTLNPIFVKNITSSLTDLSVSPTGYTAAVFGSTANHKGRIHASGKFFDGGGKLPGFLTTSTFNIPTTINGVSSPVGVINFNHKNNSVVNTQLLSLSFPITTHGYTNGSRVRVSWGANGYSGAFIPILTENWQSTVSSINGSNTVQTTTEYLNGAYYRSYKKTALINNSAFWDSQANSVEGFVNGMYVSAIPSYGNASYATTFGLSTNPNVNNQDPAGNIDYCFIIFATGDWSAYAPNLLVATQSTVKKYQNSYTVFKIYYDGTYVRYYLDDTLVGTVPRIVNGSALYFNSKFSGIGSALSQVQLGKIADQGTAGYWLEGTVKGTPSTSGMIISVDRSSNNFSGTTITTGTIIGVNPQGSLDSFGAVYNASHSGKITFGINDVSVSSSTIHIPDHRLEQNDKVIYCANNGVSLKYDETELAPSYSSSGTVCYVYKIDTDNIKLARAPSWAGNPSLCIKITSAGNNTQYLDTGVTTQIRLLSKDNAITTGTTTGSVLGQQFYTNTEFSPSDPYPTNKIGTYNNGSLADGTAEPNAIYTRGGVNLTSKYKNFLIDPLARSVPNSTGYALEIEHDCRLSTATITNNPVSIGTGTKTFSSIPGNLPIGYGQWFTATSLQSTGTSISGVVTTFNSSTGQLIVNITTCTGVLDSISSRWYIQSRYRPSPYYGGWYFSFDLSGRAGKAFVCHFTMKVPVGLYVQFGSNSIGTGGTNGWLTDNHGTGEYKEYAYYVRAGVGNLQTTFYFYLNTKPYGDSSVPPPTSLFYSYVSSATIHEVSVDFTKIENNYRGFYNQSQEQFYETALANTSHWLEIASDAQLLVDQLDLVFMSGQMSQDMKTVLFNYANSIVEPKTLNDPAIPITNYPAGYDYRSARVMECVDLILNSPQWSTLV